MGPNVLMNNTRVFKTAPTSWATVFEAQNLPDGKPNKGRIQAYDGPIYIADAALYLMTKNPALGKKILTSSTKNNMQQCLNYCANKKHLHIYIGMMSPCK